LQKILAGEKTQTRRLHRKGWKVGRVYGLRSRRFEKAQHHIIITRRFKQRLGDISIKDVQKEGFRTLEQFQAAWVRIHGGWNPDKIVTAYEFKLKAKV
jgi:hypothetical protein